MSTTESIEDTRPGPQQADEPFTLGVDIGGTNVKASVMDRQGRLVAEQVRMPTPKPATPKSVLQAIEDLAGRLPSFNRISVGFPGVVKSGTTITAPNLGTRHWAGIKLIDVLSRNPDGFVLMVEAGLIDKFSHRLDWERSTWDTIMLSNAVQEITVPNVRQ